MKISVLASILLSTNLLYASDIQVSDNLSAARAIQTEQSMNLGNAQEDFIQQQRDLIEGKQLSLWGIGLFSGRDPFSQAIKLLTVSKWSHSSAILTDEDGQKYCYESNGSPQQILQGILPQVQIHKWEDIANNYPGKIAMREFKFIDESKNDPAIISPYIFNRLGTPYEKSIEDLLRAVWRADSGGKLDSVFCSEEVAYLLMELGYLSRDDRAEDNYLPKDFSQKEFVPFIGCKLGKEISVATSGNNNCCIIL